MAVFYPAFSDIRNIYMLLDGAKIDELARYIYTANNAIEGSPIYVATPLADTLSVSPWLILINDLDAFLPLVEKIQNNGAGLIIESSSRLNELLDFWKMRLFVDLPDGQEVIFRLYEPSVLSALLVNGSPLDKEQLMGPNEIIWYWDEKQGEWKSLVKEGKEIVPLTPRFKLTQEHLVTLTKLKQRQYAPKLYSHISHYFPSAISNKEQGDKLVESVLDKAISLGFTGGQSLFYFANIWATLGDTCLDFNVHPEIATLLTQNSHLSHATRLEHAAQLIVTTIEK